jgi:5-amino-6-(5-phospho-D-ribitylamino)uracil phosphatase
MGSFAMSIMMVVTDLDNTLLHRDKMLSDYTVGVFEQLRQQGVRVALATARHMAATIDYQERICPDIIALSNGTMIFAGNQIVREFAMPSETANSLLLELAASGKMKKISARGQKAVYTTDPDCTYEQQTFCDFKAPIADRITHLSFRCEDDDLARTIVGHYGDLEFWHNSGDILYDVNPFGATKANAVKFFADYFQIPLQKIAAFGDDHNDLAMLQQCGIGVAVANAIDECRSEADFVCGDCDDDGVAHWLDENILRSISVERNETDEAG